ncbi:hypothetical protein SAMN04489835_0084 [Mycolicibacterium rutilum]|uniref:Uncharacterized protein n=1 Tax=Mycolicibacterium rutilum TaxID=370526 RepID=A0A1H6ID91_MYCRU|nr:hypothetical protein SAMN04489835_0084 [Mycolicibacterium rutilum]
MTPEDSDCVDSPAYALNSLRHTSRIGGNTRAIRSPTIRKYASFLPIGSGISKASPDGTWARIAANSAVRCVLPSLLNRAASSRVKVLFSCCGASLRTASRWLLVMQRTKSAPVIRGGVSCRAENCDGSPPRSSSTRAAEGSMGCPTSACVPALDTSSCLIPDLPAYASIRRSAIGERQMFPVQTNSTCIADSSKPFLEANSGVRQSCLPALVESSMYLESVERANRGFVSLISTHPVPRRGDGALTPDVGHGIWITQLLAA